MGVGSGRLVCMAGQLGRSDPAPTALKIAMLVGGGRAGRCLGTIGMEGGEISGLLNPLEAKHGFSVGVGNTHLSGQLDPRLSWQAGRARSVQVGSRGAASLLAATLLPSIPIASGAPSCDCCDGEGPRQKACCPSGYK